MNGDIATDLSWIAMWALQDKPPLVPSRGERWVSFPTREQRRVEKRVLQANTQGRDEGMWENASGDSDSYEDSEEEPSTEESSEPVLGAIHITHME